MSDSEKKDEVETNEEKSPFKIRKRVIIALIISFLVFAFFIYDSTLRNTKKTIETHEGIYIGHVKGYEFHGQGRFEFNNGTIYEGYWQDGLMHGEGTMHFVNGAKLKGTFHQGNPQGEFTSICLEGEEKFLEYGEHIKVQSEIFDHDCSSCNHEQLNNRECKH